MRSLHTVCACLASSLLQPLIWSSAESQLPLLRILPPTLSCHPLHTPHSSRVFCTLGGPDRGRMPTLIELHPLGLLETLGMG